MKRPLTALVLTLSIGCTHLAAQRTRRAAHSVSTHTASDSTAIKNVFWQPNNLTQGSPAFFTVELERPATRVAATWSSKALAFFKTTDSKVWYALAGDDIETRPGIYGISVTATLAGGRVAKTEKQVEIADGNFKTGSIDVAPNYVDPDEEGKRQIAVDERLKARAYAQNTLRPLWSGNFRKPVSGAATDSFGETRVLNEEKTSEHRGTDFEVPEGSPVEAANSGVVVLSAAMFYEGNCVIIDHGQKLFTIYMHLSRMEVKPGDKVKKGQRLGVSGATGRVTGPHMHMGARWNGAYLDPVKLIALTLPAIPANEGKTATPSHRPARKR